MIDSFRGEYWCFSNFSLFALEYRGITFPTLEHAYQAQKTQDDAEQQAIALLPDPAKAKAYGKRLKEWGLIRPDWAQVKLKIMTDLTRIKFDTYPVLKVKLLATEDEYIEEGNRWHDNYWGDCKCEKCSSIVGENRIGKILMELREAYRK